MGRTFVCAILVFSLFPLTSAAQGRKTQPVLGLALPDLVIEAPVVSDQPGYVSAKWKVSNAGAQTSPASHVEIRCTANYVEGKKSMCGESPRTMDIPPLAKGDSYMVAVDDAAWIESKTAPPRYRFTIVAKVDPSNKIKEANEGNNQVSYTAENFQGPPPAKPVVRPSGTVVPAQKKEPDVKASAAGPLVKVVPHMKLTTDPPTKFDPGKPFWIVLTNIDPAVDAKQITVTMACETEKLGAGPYGGFGFVSCDSVGNFDLPQVDWSTTVGPIPHGKFKALYEIKPPIGPHAGGFGGAGSAGIKLTFHASDAICTDLVLDSTK